MRATTASAPSSERVAVVCIPNTRVPSAEVAPTTMFVPPRSTPTMKRSGEAVAVGLIGGGI